MGITMAQASAKQYEESIKKLFPQGDYWDEQFSDSSSDASLFVKVKTGELLRFKNRMADLYAESKTETTNELIADWERILLNGISSGLDLQERRTLLSVKTARNLTRAAITETAELFGLSITGMAFPYRPAFFGFSRFGQDHISSPASWQALHLYISGREGNERIADFEKQLQSRVLSNYIVHFIYGGS